MNKQVSDFDKYVYEVIRENVSAFIKEQAEKHDALDVRVLDIAPQDHGGAREFFVKSEVLTADIDEKSNADYIVDILENNVEKIPDESFDIIVCTEVIEHTLNPFLAIDEIQRMLKKGGYLFMSTPFNFRIHGPLPDCWRFTEHGIRALLKNYDSVEIQSIDDVDRFLMPLHYTTIAKK